MEVLYLEDVTFIREGMCNLLRKNNIKFSSAKTSLEAYNLFKIKKHDIAIIDINVPFTNDKNSLMASGEKYHFNDGLELSYKMIEENPNIYVIILSGNLTSDSLIVEAYGKGVKDFIKKPYKVDRLLQAISIAKVAVTKKKGGR